jgi:hypothetical protein
MTWQSVLINLGKLLVCVAAFAAGLALGGMLAAALNLAPPPLPAGLDPAAAGLAMLLESPLWVLVLIGLSRFITGPFAARALMLAWFTWITNAVNNQIEASFFGSMASGFWYTIVTFLGPSLLVAAAVAWLFGPPAARPGLAATGRSFFGRYSAPSWLWRLGLAAVLFMPIYYCCGLLVIPFTIEYYRQGLFGLQIPPLHQLLAILFVRSVLFFLACLPIVVAWQRSRRSLALYLGLALFFFVGFQALMIANWMPWSLRLPHMIEILADEFIYAGALAMLLGAKSARVRPSWSIRKRIASIGSGGAMG